MLKNHFNLKWSMNMEGVIESWDIEENGKKSFCSPQIYYRNRLGFDDDDNLDCKDSVVV